MENRRTYPLSLDEQRKTLDFMLTIHDSRIPKEDKIIPALELAARCQHWTKECPKYFILAIPSNIIQMMLDIGANVEEYLNTHNVRFGFCPIRRPNKEPVMKELESLYIDNIDTYNEVLEFAKKMATNKDNGVLWYDANCGGSLWYTGNYGW